jgi:phosphotransferase system HPr-like phosphotransfer protein
MSMGAEQGSLIQLQALGDDAGPALIALKGLIQQIR